MIVADSVWLTCTIIFIINGSTSDRINSTYFIVVILWLISTILFFKTNCFVYEKNNNDFWIVFFSLIKSEYSSKNLVMSVRWPWINLYKKLIQMYFCTPQENLMKIHVFFLFRQLFWNGYVKKITKRHLWRDNSWFIDHLLTQPVLCQKSDNLPTHHTWLPAMRFFLIPGIKIAAKGAPFWQLDDKFVKKSFTGLFFEMETLQEKVFE